MEVRDTQLYIGRLPLSINERELHKHLSAYGNVVKINLKQTKNETKFAFVEYKTNDEAETCRQTLNGQLIDGHSILVSRAVNKFDTKCNLFIKSIPTTATVNQFQERFQPYGRINSCMICKDSKTGVSLGYGFILYDQFSSAEAAQRAQDNSRWGDQNITVSHFLTVAERGDLAEYKNLYIRGFPVELDQDYIRHTFGQFGQLVSCAIIKKVMWDGIQRAFGFVCYQTHQQAKLAEQSMNGKVQGDINWTVIKHLSKKQMQAQRERKIREIQNEWKQKNVFIGNLGKFMTEGQLHQICSEFGTVSSVRIPVITDITYDEYGNFSTKKVSKGFGYALFQNSQSAQRAVIGLKSRSVNDQNLYSARWKPKSEIMKNKRIMIAKKMMWDRQMMQRMPMGAHPMMGGPMGGPMGGSMMPPMMGVPAMPGAQMMGGPPMPGPAMMSPPPMPGPMMGQQMGMPPSQAGMPMMNPAMRPKLPIPRTGGPPMPPPAPQQPPRPAPPVAPPSTGQKLSKQDYGERLYPKVINISNEKVAAKITGMLLEMPEQELERLNQSEEELHKKVNEAIMVLRDAWKEDPQKLRDLPW